MVGIHILGASGSGTTTLGAALSTATGFAHLDTDDYYWLPTEPPYTTPRPAETRVAMLKADLAGVQDWVLSGSALKWGRPLEPLFDLVVFLKLDPKLRMARIVARERLRYGDRIAPGGDMHEQSQAFLAWAAAYDDAGPEQRSLAGHEAFLAGCIAPVLRLNSDQPVERLVEAVLAHPAVVARRLTIR